MAQRGNLKRATKYFTIDFLAFFIEALDKLRFRDFLKKFYNRDIPDGVKELRQLLQNMNLAVDDGRLNHAGLLLFTETPE